MSNNTYTIDGVAFTVATTSSVWLAYFNDALAVTLGVGAAALLIVRIALAIREWRRGSRKPPVG